MVEKSNAWLCRLTKNQISSHQDALRANACHPNAWPDRDHIFDNVDVDI
jgi:hypothetical protein